MAKRDLFSEISEGFEALENERVFVNQAKRAAEPSSWKSKAVYFFLKAFCHMLGVGLGLVFVIWTAKWLLQP